MERLKNTFGFEFLTSLTDLREAYKKLAFKHHPDKGGDTAIMQDLNNAYRLFSEKFINNQEYNPKSSRTHDQQKQDAYQYNGMFMDAVDNIINLEGITIELIGNWLWVTGNTKPHKDILKENKFVFSGQKMAWYLKDPNWMKTFYKKYELDEIRNLYGSQKIGGTGRGSNIRRSY
jgi:oligoribonuclease NrnB/cAMP/cGMP phosphodiesterase (DHH superfamily)